MARKPQRRTTFAADTVEANNYLANAAILKISPDNEILDDLYGYFLLNPSSYQENKTANWVSHDIPGQSDPIMSWVSSGARTLSFEALVTKDHSSYNIVKPPSALEKLGDAALSAVGNIASAFAGVNLPAISDLFGVGGQDTGEDLSIAEILNYYRSLMYPTYDDKKNILKQSPPLVALFIGKTFSRNMAFDSLSVDTDLWIVKDLSIKITKQLPNLSPMEAMVSFQLIEYVRRSKSAQDFLAFPQKSKTGLGDFLPLGDIIV